VQQLRCLINIYGKDIEKDGQLFPALISADLILDEYRAYKTLLWERGWAGGANSDEDVFQALLMDDNLCEILSNVIILILIEGIQWLESATCERGFSLRTQILTAQRFSMGDSLLSCLMMIVANGPSLDQKEEVQGLLLAAINRFKAFKKRVPSRSCTGNRPQRASASKATSSVLAQLSGLENVVFNDFIDDAVYSDGISDQMASASFSH